MAYPVRGKENLYAVSFNICHSILFELPKIMLLLLYVCLLLTYTTSACFLNSCPYRRYGRTPTCLSCGIGDVGVCISESKCCTSIECFESERCTSYAICPSNYCKIAGVPGVCQGIHCCVEDICLKSLMCS